MEKEKRAQELPAACALLCLLGAGLGGGKLGAGGGGLLCLRVEHAASQRERDAWQAKAKRRRVNGGTGREGGCALCTMIVCSCVMPEEVRVYASTTRPCWSVLKRAMQAVCVLLLCAAPAPPCRAVCLRAPRGDARALGRAEGQEGGLQATERAAAQHERQSLIWHEEEDNLARDHHHAPQQVEHAVRVGLRMGRAQASRAGQGRAPTTRGWIGRGLRGRPILVAQPCGCGVAGTR